MNRIGWRGWLVAFAIFGLGLAVGVSGTVVVGKRMLRQMLVAPADATGPADRAAARIAAELNTSLKLTPDEAQRVQQILEDSARTLKTIRRRAALAAGLELRSSAGRIAVVLPPDKRAEFYRLIAQRYERLGLPAPSAPANDQGPAAKHQAPDTRNP